MDNDTQENSESADTSDDNSDSQSSDSNDQNSTAPFDHLSTSVAATFANLDSLTIDPPITSKLAAGFNSPIIDPPMASKFTTDGNMPFIDPPLATKFTATLSSQINPTIASKLAANLGTQLTGPSVTTKLAATSLSSQSPIYSNLTNVQSFTINPKAMKALADFTLASNNINTLNRRLAIPESLGVQHSLFEAFEELPGLGSSIDEFTSAVNNSKKHRNKKPENRFTHSPGFAYDGVIEGQDEISNEEIKGEYFHQLGFFITTAFYMIDKEIERHGLGPAIDEIKKRHWGLQLAYVLYSIFQKI